jgi:hypothetical protein
VEALCCANASGACVESRANTNSRGMIFMTFSFESDKGFQTENRASSIPVGLAKILAKT